MWTVGGFARQSSGALLWMHGPKGCVRPPKGTKKVRAACNPGRALLRPTDLLMAPDGASLYVLTHGSEPIDDGGVVTLKIGPDGSIHQAKAGNGCITALGQDGCRPGRSMDQGTRMAMSLDGSSMYTTSHSGGVAVLQRDDGTGRLKQPGGERGCVISQFNPLQSTCRRAAVPDGIPVDIVVSIDGAYVYVLYTIDGVSAIGVYARNPDNGGLTLHSCIAEGSDAGGCTPVHGLAGGKALTISPDGRMLYAASSFFEDGGAVATFVRDADSGALTQLDGADGCLSAVPYPDCGQGPKFYEPASMGASHDGTTIFVVYRRNAKDTAPGGILASFSRDPSSGVLAYDGCVSATVKTCEKAGGIGAFDEVTISVDGRTLYLGGRSRLGIFELG